MAVAARKKVEDELSAFQATATKMSEELKSTQDELKSLKDDLAKLKAEVLSLKASNSEGLEALKTVQAQRGKLADKLGATRAELANTKKALTVSSDTVKATAKDAFNMALALIHHFNPTVTLEFRRVLFRSPGSFEDSSSTTGEVGGQAGCH